MKLLRGGVFYRDVDAYPFPLATYLLAAGWRSSASTSRRRAGSPRSSTARAGGPLRLGPRAARTAARRGLRPLLLSFKLLAWPSFTAYAYWDVAFTLGCVAVALLLRHRFGGGRCCRRCGLLIGLALLAKQSLGIYLAAAAGAHCSSRAASAAPRRSALEAVLEAAALAIGVAVPVAAAAAYFASEGLLARCSRAA